MMKLKAKYGKITVYVRSYTDGNNYALVCRSKKLDGGYFKVNLSELNNIESF